jgi:hypothetical protein
MRHSGLDDLMSLLMFLGCTVRVPCGFFILYLLFGVDALIFPIVVFSFVCGRRVDLSYCGFFFRLR